MTRSPRWIIACLILPALIVVGGLAAAFEIALASSGSSGGRPEAALFKDDDGKSGRDDDKGHDRDDHDDDRRADVPRPDIPADQLGDVVVEIIDERFVPATFTLEAGQRVTFINLDDDEHTGTGIGFDTGDLEPGEWATVVITGSGAIPFVCQYHGEMQGTITVIGGATPVASPMASPVPLGTPAGDEVTIEISDFVFADTAVTIPAGTTVLWVNTGQAPHTVTGAFGDSGALQHGDSYRITFTEAGVYEYVCAFHPNMTATITVT